MTPQSGMSEPDYVLDVGPGQPRRDRPRRAGRAGQPPAPCVLLLSRSCDAEFDAVGRLLGKLGVTVARINADELATVDLLMDRDRGTVCLDGSWLVPTITWNRHFSAQAIEAAGGPAHDLFRRESWQAVASQLAVLSPVSIGSRRIGLLEQQSLARRHRIATPRTVVATDPERARDLLGARRLVIKAADQHFVEASPGRLTGFFPVIVGFQEPLPPFQPGSPVIVQEYVEHDMELRVYYVDGEVLGFEVRKEAPADLWLAIDRVEVRHRHVPGQVAWATRLLAACLALRFGAFDFLVRDGMPVFLEVNPDGDWRWAEQKSESGHVTMAAAHMLCRLHRKTRLGRRAAGDRPADSFDLIRFLSTELSDGRRPRCAPRRCRPRPATRCRTRIRASRRRRAG